MSDREKLSPQEREELGLDIAEMVYPDSGVEVGQVIVDLRTERVLADFDTYPDQE